VSAARRHLIAIGEDSDGGIVAGSDQAVPKGRLADLSNAAIEHHAQITGASTRTLMCGTGREMESTWQELRTSAVARKR